MKQDVFPTDEPDYVILPVEPQPNCDHVVLIMTHVCCFGMGLTPIMIDVTDFGRLCFVAYLQEPYISLNVLREIMGPEWIPGAIVLLGVQTQPIEPYERYRVQRGMLVRVRRNNRAVNFDSLQEQINEPAVWARHVDAVGMPVPRRLIGWYSIHEEKGSDRSFPNFARRAGTELRNETS